MDVWKEIVKGICIQFAVDSIRQFFCIFSFAIENHISSLVINEDIHYLKSIYPKDMITDFIQSPIEIECRKAVLL